MVGYTQGRFSLGHVVATPGALKAIRECGEVPTTFLVRHAQGDWGVVDDEDGERNAEALVHGERVVSAYLTKLGSKIWIITEADRSATTILLPSEY